MGGSCCGAPRSGLCAATPSAPETVRTPRRSEPRDGQNPETAGTPGPEPGVPSGAGGEQLSDLQRVQRRALAQVVPAEEQVQCPRLVQRPPDPADVGRIGPD